MQWFAGLTVATALVAACNTARADGVTPPADAYTTDPFEYKLEVTPEEGPVDNAVESRYTTLFDDCQQRAQITRENAAYLEAEFIRQDAALNTAWKAALGRLPAATHKPLLAAQRKWIAARDPFCRADADGGTIAPVEYSSCRVELTIRRTIWLEHLH